jgi:superoxide dismutase
MELHHSKHHQTYVTNLNNALKAHQAAVVSNDVPGQIALQAAIKFNGGGHINHSLFWRNLAPASSPSAQPSAAPALMAEIEKTYGGLDAFRKTFSAALLGIQGSGWGWLVVKDARLAIVTTKDQDPVVGGETPIFGVDMWEHAYYLQVRGPFFFFFFLFLFLFINPFASCPLLKEYLFRLVSRYRFAPKQFLSIDCCAEPLSFHSWVFILQPVVFMPC